MRKTQFHFQWSADARPSRFRTGVSLHSHTLHSRESLDFIYHAARHSALLRTAIRRGEARYRAHYGVDLDFRRGWWTPPLAPLDAYNVEADQIRSLGNEAAIVSLTDHDDIEAPMSLKAVDPSRAVPISVEWTVPFGATFFHLGIHNLPPRKARAFMEAFRELTARPANGQLHEILRELHSRHRVLIVFNHPLWDEKGVGADLHRRTVLEFLSQNGDFIHAMELNGLRPWSENRLAIQLAKEWSKPVVSGGDRHAIEPNATLNLSDATTFAEFAGEIRDGLSNVFITSHYRQGFACRILHNMLDVLRTYENHGRGWKQWPDRVFYKCADGTVQSLRELWGTNFPAPVRIFEGCMKVLGNSSMRGAFRAASMRSQQVAI